MKEEEKKETKTYNDIRLATAAGQFYPGEEKRLEFKIDEYLKNVSEQEVDGRVKAVIVPHAGYQFSGQVAAHAYKLLKGKKVGTVVIICNSHTTFFDGVAVDESDAWETPLGLVEVDQELAKKIVAADEAIMFNSKPHQAADHTLEVQLPFLQTVLENDFKIVPILFGNQHDDSYKKLAQALAKNLGEDDIVIISTDMSHYPSYENANRVDQETLEIIKTADIAKLDEHIEKVMKQNIPNEDTVLCGQDGVKTGIEMYNLLGWESIEVLKYANSGDAGIGDKGSVVGYGAVVFSAVAPAQGSSTGSFADAQDDNQLNSGQKKELLRIARETVESFVRDGEVLDFEVSDKRLNWKEGAFVTLRLAPFAQDRHKEGELRGCIGQIIPSKKPLWEVVRDMAISACSEDHRFNPVSKKELDKIDYEVSVLSVPEKIDDWRKIELGKHGVIVKKGFKGGVFLPQVATETGWSLEEFLSQLCYQKAGLAPDCYKNDPDVELEVYTAQVFDEEDVE